MRIRDQNCNQEEKENLLDKEFELLPLKLIFIIHFYINTSKYKSLDI
jgi:hypothetical protein